MRVESAEQGIRFEWDGEPSKELAVGLHGLATANQERLALLKQVIREQRHDGIEWVDLELRERMRTDTRSGVDLLRPRLLLWRAEFGTWEEAAVAFTVLCRAVGMDDDGVRLEVEL